MNIRPVIAGYPTAPHGRHHRRIGRNRDLGQRPRPPARRPAATGTTTGATATGTSTDLEVVGDRHRRGRSTGRPRPPPADDHHPARVCARRQGAVADHRIRRPTGRRPRPPTQPPAAAAPPTPAAPTRSGTAAPTATGTRPPATDAGGADGVAVPRAATRRSRPSRPATTHAAWTAWETAVQASLASRRDHLRRPDPVPRVWTTRTSRCSPASRTAPTIYLLDKTLIAGDQIDTASGCGISRTAPAGWST